MSGTTDLPAAVGQRVLDAVVAVTSDLDLDQVLQRIVQGAMDLTGARYGALGVLDPVGPVVDRGDLGLSLIHI